MEQNKTKTYILIIAVIGVWGAIGYQFVNGLNPEVPELSQNTIDTSFNPVSSKTMDTFSIHTPQRDPFLGTAQKKVASPKAKTAVSKKPKANKKEVLVSYQGLIQRKKSSDKVFVISINGKQHLLKTGQKTEHLTLVRGNEKQIQVRINQTLKTIALEKL